MTTLNDKETRRLRKGKCPTCRSRNHWTRGPSGGGSQNIFCEKCKSGYNVLPAPFSSERIPYMVAR